MKNTATLTVAGRLKEIDEMWMQFEPCRPETYLTYVGGRAAKNAPQIAISFKRPAGIPGIHFFPTAKHAIEFLPSPETVATLNRGGGQRAGKSKLYIPRRYAY